MKGEKEGREGRREGRLTILSDNMRCLCLCVRVQRKKPRYIHSKIIHGGGLTHKDLKEVRKLIWQSHIRRISSVGAVKWDSIL